MSIESLDQLESKIQNVVDSLALHKMEAEELREANTSLKEENTQQKQELQAYSERVNSLLDKLTEDAF
ncbi:MAG: cell division protein ZapB [Endozoicomonadaceae bacterium]|nr:cell division protein ZapB [Endozoicomonadaceae bacterium]